MKEPGRELDAEIAVKVMGWSEVLHDGERGTGFWDIDGMGGSGNRLCSDDELPHYSTDIAAAWLVVEKMQEKGQVLALVNGDEWETVKMVARAPGVFQWGAVFDDEGFRPYSLAPTAPHAICLAALAAIGEGGA